MPGLIRRLLISFRRPWRGVPELDALTDRQGAALVGGLKSQARGRDAARGNGAPIPTSLYILFAAGCLIWIAWTIFSLASSHWLLAVAFGLLLFCRPWDHLLFIRQQVNARLREDWCQGCAYPLYELPACDGPMECPRCRRPCIARESIRAPADLLACDVDAHADRARRKRSKLVDGCACGYPLRGLPVEARAVLCPECGVRYEVRGGGFVRL